MKKLFLASQIEEVESQLREALPGTPDSLHLLFVPTASNYKERHYTASSEWKFITAFGFTVTVSDFTTSSVIEIGDAVSSADVVFVAGGNSFHLLNEMRRTGANKILTDFVNEGGLYVGSSAGSILAAPDIAYIAPMDNPEMVPRLTDYHGLDFTDAAIVPHVDVPKRRPAVKEIERKYGDSHRLLFLRDNQALLVDGEESRIV